MARVLSTVAKAVAGALVGAGIYQLGHQMGREEALETDAALAEPEVRPGLRMRREAAQQVSADAEAYHEKINGAARELKMRIATQAYAGVPLAVTERMAPVDAAEGVGFGAGETLKMVPGQEAAARGASQDTGDLDPYRKIRNAISTSSFFEGEDGTPLKPNQFTMP